MLRDPVPSIDAARAAISARRLDEALKIASTRLANDPHDIDALEVRAIVETERGQFGEAEATLRRAIAAAPDRRWHYSDLSRLLAAQNRKDAAETVARMALAVDPDNADAHAMLGSLLVERAALVPGAQHLEHALALVGRHPMLVGALGHALMRQGRLDEARPLLTEAMTADPSALLPAAHLAELEERAELYDAARRHLERAEAIARAQGRDMLLQRATLLTRSGDWEAALALLDAQRDMAGPALLQRGRLRDRAGRHGEAWSDWTTGKAQLARATGRSYPRQEVQRRTEALAAFFTADRIAALPRAQKRDDVPQPIFVIGFPRSGTTLTEQILASHSRVRAGGELPFGRALRDQAAAMAGGEARFPQALADLDGDWPTALRDEYLAGAHSYGLCAAGADYFTDKMPLNDQWLPLLHLAFPASPIIHVRRHPLDILVSVMAHDMTHGSNCGYRLEDASHHLALIDATRASYCAAGVPIHELGYETLVADQRGETERLMAAVGLSMEQAQLAFHEREAVSPTPSYAQVRAPLNPASIGRWRQHRDALAPVRDVVAAVIVRGGYA